MTSVTTDPQLIAVVENINNVFIPNRIKEAGFDMVFKPVLFDCFSAWRYEFLKHVGYWDLPKDTIIKYTGNEVIFNAIKDKFLEN